MTRGVVAVLLACVAGAAGCNSKPAVPAVKWVAADDPAMAAARDKARATVGTFRAALKAPKPGQTGFAVKKAFTDGTTTEHIWLSKVSFDGTNYLATVDNVPEKLRTVTLGQRVTVAPADLGDWMFIDGRKLVGGYTIRAMRDALSPAERADFDRGVPFGFD